MTHHDCIGTKRGKIFLSAKRLEPAFCWDQIDRLRPPADDAPPDSFTVAEYADRYSLPERTARGQLFAFVRAGKLQAGTKHVIDSAGRRRLVRCFWIPKGVSHVVDRRGRRNLRAAQFRSVREAK